MAEPDSILQLGIEAARDGNKEEARNLFRLLTRQEPGNAQAWLWLAGVAENREERQAALERVVELDPTNEMAVKGLQALGVRPGSGRPVAPPPAPEPELPASPKPLPVSADTDPFADDDPFAELDNLSDVMASDVSGPVRRADTPASRIDPFDDTGSSAPNDRARRGRYNTYSDDDETAPARRGVSPLLAILLVLVGLGLIGLLIFFLFPDFFGGSQGTAVVTPAQQTSLAATKTALGSGPILSGTTAPTGEPTVAGGAAITTTEPISPTTSLEQPTVAAITEQPTPEAATQAPAVDLSQANPAIVPPNTPLESNGWLYDFNQPTYASPIIGPLGQYSPNNGRFVIVLIFAVNRSGQEQAIPDNFFVLKDAQGRIWEARPEVSSAYVMPGVNADIAHSQAIPPDGLTRSVALIFDVAPDATNLVFFARSNPSQGWLVLQAV